MDKKYESEKLKREAGKLAAIRGKLSRSVKNAAPKKLAGSIPAGKGFTGARNSEDIKER